MYRRIAEGAAVGEQGHAGPAGLDAVPDFRAAASIWPP